MKLPQVLIVIGCAGVLFSTTAGVWAQLGPCESNLGGDCYCSYHDGPGSNDYWFFCEDHQFNMGQCDNQYGDCGVNPVGKCFDNEHTNKVKCTDSPCQIECEMLSETCQLIGPLCPNTNP